MSCSSCRSAWAVAGLAAAGLVLTVAGCALAIRRTLHGERDWYRRPVALLALFLLACGTAEAQQPSHLVILRPQACVLAVYVRRGVELDSVAVEFTRVPVSEPIDSIGRLLATVPAGCDVLVSVSPFRFPPEVSWPECRRVVRRASWPGLGGRPP